MHLCHVFDHFTVTRDGNTYRIQVWGRLTGATACPTAISELDGRVYELQPPHTGAVHVVVQQPDGSSLEKTILIE